MCKEAGGDKSGGETQCEGEKDADEDRDRVWDDDGTRGPAGQKRAQREQTKRGREGETKTREGQQQRLQLCNKGTSVVKWVRVLCAHGDFSMNSH